MRTRRSPRNQEILWRALGQEGAPSPGLRVNVNSVESLERQLASARLNAAHPRTVRMIEREIVAARRRAALRPREVAP